MVDRHLYGLTRTELAALRRLSAPEKIQAYLIGSSTTSSPTATEALQAVERMGDGRRHDPEA